MGSSFLALNVLDLQNIWMIFQNVWMIFKNVWKIFQNNHKYYQKMDYSKVWKLQSEEIVFDTECVRSAKNGRFTKLRLISSELSVPRCLPLPILNNGKDTEYMRQNPNFLLFWHKGSFFDKLFFGEEADSLGSLLFDPNKIVFRTS